MTVRRCVRLACAAAVLISIGSVAAVTAPSTVGATRTCGYARWPVKNLLDPAAVRVKLNGRRSHISDLRKLPRPSGINNTTPRLSPVELGSYAIDAPLIAARRMPSYDTVAVIGRPPDTMLVVFPDTHLCNDIGLGPHGGDIHSASDGFNADCGPSIPSDHWTRLSGDAAIIGVAFFDVKHKTAIPGAAPNGLERIPRSASGHQTAARSPGPGRPVEPVIQHRLGGVRIGL